MPVPLLASSLPVPTLKQQKTARCSCRLQQGACTRAPQQALPSRAPAARRPCTARTRAPQVHRQPWTWPWRAGLQLAASLGRAVLQRQRRCAGRSLIVRQHQPAEHLLPTPCLVPSPAQLGVCSGGRHITARLSSTPGRRRPAFQQSPQLSRPGLQGNPGACGSPGCPGDGLCG